MVEALPLRRTWQTPFTDLVDWVARHHRSAAVVLVLDEWRLEATVVSLGAYEKAMAGDASVEPWEVPAAALALDRAIGPGVAPLLDVRVREREDDGSGPSWRLPHLGLPVELVRSWSIRYDAMPTV
jgi:hypothetical protein